MPVVVVAWVSFVQSRQLGITHLYVYSHEALNGYSVLLHIVMVCVRLVSKFPWLSYHSSFITKA